MLRSQVLENTWKLSVDERPFIAHRLEAPFAVALRRASHQESSASESSRCSLAISQTMAS